MDMKSRLNTLIPISRLPAEVLSEIFLHYAAESRREHPYSPIQIAQVCHRWREVALSTPQLWSDITVVGFELTQEIIARSQQAPLSVTIDFMPDRTESIKRVLQELHRIQSLDWSIPRDVSPQLASCFTGPAARLRALTISNSDAPFETNEAPLPAFISKLDPPRLEELTIMDYDVSWSSPIFRPTLTHLVITRQTFTSSITLNDVVRALEGMPLLEHLDLQSVLPPSGAMAPHSATDQVERTVNLSRLKFLGISDTFNSCLGLFDKLSFSASTTVTLDLYPYNNLDLGSYNDARPFELGHTIARGLARAEASSPGQPLRSLAILCEETPSYRTHILGWTDVLSAADLNMQTAESLSPSIWITVPGSTNSLRLSEMLPVANVRVLRIDNIWGIDVVAALAGLQPSVPPYYGSTRLRHPLRQFTQLETLRLSAVDPYTMLTAFESDLASSLWLGDTADAPLLFPRLKTVILESVHFTRPVGDDPYSNLLHPMGEDKKVKSYAPDFRDVLLARTKKNAAPITLVLRTCINIGEDEVDSFKNVVGELCWDGIENWLEPESSEDVDDEYDEYHDIWE